MVKPSLPKPSSEMNITPMIDVRAGDVSRVGIITAGMRRGVR